MTKNKVAFLAALMAVSQFIPVEAIASDRYKVRAPVVVDSSLTGPWLNQLGQVRPRVKAYVGTSRPATQQRVVYRQQPVRQRQVAAKPKKQGLPAQFLPQMVDYQTTKKAGSIIIDTNNKYLYLVMGNGKARRYGVGVAKPGFEWAGTHKVTRKQEWPTWTPPKEMIAREAAKGHYLPDFMDGGPANPLGARALYLGSTLYRIHGTNAPWTIGQTVSSGCIRMRNEDVVDLYERVRVGAQVTVI